MELTTIPINTPVTAVFARPVDRATLNSASFSLDETSSAAPVTGAFSFDFGDAVAVFTPDAPLARNTSYTLYITREIKSVEGIPLDLPFSGSFTTAGAADTTAPRVTVSPGNGATEVPFNSQIVFGFSEAMNSATINASTITVTNNGTAVTGGVALGQQNSVATFIPDQPLPTMTLITVTLAAGIADVAGNATPTAFTASFTTQASQDNYQPSVESVSPASGATGVPVNTAVVITFSEPMNPLTLKANNCYLVYGGWYWGQQVPSTITLANNNTVATLTPTQPLFAGSSYSVWVTTNAQDVAGNPLSSQFASSFTTTTTPGIDLPNGATITINPRSIFANGQIATTVILSNINRNGTPVPNGTLIGVTAEPAFVPSSVGGVISGNSVGTSPDSRFLLFSTEGASVTLSYTPPDLDWLTPGATVSGVIQVAAIDLDNRPVSLIAQGTATLFRIQTAAMSPETTTLPADGISQTAVEVIVRDNLGNLVPEGTEVGITAEPIFGGSTADGTIVGGATSTQDSRVQVFTTAGGRFTFSYQAPNDQGPGYGAIQAVAVDRQGYPTGLISTLHINLTNP